MFAKLAKRKNIYFKMFLCEWFWIYILMVSLSLLLKVIDVLLLIEYQTRSLTLLL